MEIDPPDALKEFATEIINELCWWWTFSVHVVFFGGKNKKSITARKLILSIGVLLFFQ